MRLFLAAFGRMSRKSKRAPRGALSWENPVWQVQDLNLRRLSRRFYSL